MASPATKYIATLQQALDAKEARLRQAALEITSLQAQLDAAKTDMLAVPDSIVEANVRELRTRSRIGLSKYGVSLDRDDLQIPDWVQHLLEELLDAANYAQAIKRRLAEQPPKLGDGTPDAALAIGEDAFRAGWEACYAKAIPSSQPNEMAAEREAAWSDYEPPEHIKELS